MKEWRKLEDDEMDDVVGVLRVSHAPLRVELDNGLVFHGGEISPSDWEDWKTALHAINVGEDWCPVRSSPRGWEWRVSV